MALTTVSELETWMGLTPSASGDAQHRFLSQMLDAVEAAFLRLIDRQIEARQYTLYECGNWSQVLRLPEYPVQSVSAVYLDDRGAWGQAPDAFPASSLLTEGVDYALARDGRDAEGETARLYRINTVWTGRWQYLPGLLTPRRVPGAGNVKIVCRAGYESVPADIPLAIWQVCARLRASRKRGMPLAGEGYEEYFYRVDTAAIDQAWRLGEPAQIVAKYKRITPRHVVLG